VELVASVRVPDKLVEDFTHFEPEAAIAYLLK
jgi:hypothetical protein